MTSFKKRYFVSGIDTDAGKSYVTGYLARKWRSEGYSVITHKLIQTGCAENDISEDILTHRNIMSIPLLPEDLDHTTCPLRFTYPCSPDVAARLDNREVDLGLVYKSIDKLSEKYDVILIEGAGGLMVPIIDYYTMVDYAKEHSLPIILVTNPRLGSINHTLMSINICIAKGVQLDYLVYNKHGGSSDIITKETGEFLERYISDIMPDCQFIEVPDLSK